MRNKICLGVTGWLRGTQANAGSQISGPVGEKIRCSSCDKTALTFHLNAIEPRKYRACDPEKKGFVCLQRTSVNIFHPASGPSARRQVPLGRNCCAGWLGCLVAWCDKTSPTLFPLLLWTHMCTLLRSPFLDFISL